MILAHWTDEAHLDAVVCQFELFVLYWARVLAGKSPSAAADAWSQSQSAIAALFAKICNQKIKSAVFVVSLSPWHAS